MTSFSHQPFSRSARFRPGASLWVYLCWTFPDGSAVVLGQCTWRVLCPDILTRNPTEWRLRQRHNTRSQLN